MSTAMPTQTADATEVRTLRNYVGGRFVEAATSEHLDVTEPATGALLARVPLSSAADVDAAVRGAQEAFPAWRRTPTIERARAHVHAAPGAPGARSASARSVTRTWARRSRRLRRGRRARSRWSSAPAAVPDDDAGPQPRERRDATSTARPTASRSACSAAICPFNFPAMVPMWFLPFAVACGNTFVLKPSEQVPLAQEAIFELIHDLELLPPGVVNLVNGGREVVEGISTTPASTASSFVGSARSRSSCTSVPRAPASACRRSAGPRTTWS